MANLTDNERYLLALTLADALLAEPGPYAAPDRITATASLLAGDFRLALTYLSTRPHAAPGGKEPDHRVLGWWDFGSVDFRSDYPDAALLTYPTSLPVMKQTGTYSVALVGNLLGSGLYAGPGLVKSEAVSLYNEAVRLHGRSMSKNNLKIDLVVTRHRPLVELLRERGIITSSTPVLEHPTVSDVAGKNVLGILPHWLSSKTASVTEVPMNGLTQADREAMTKGDLSLDRTREVAGQAVTYYVSTERPWPVMSCFARAVVHACPFSTFNADLAQGVLELTAAESTDAAQIDLYRNRYRTWSMGGEWSPWLNERGEVDENQSVPSAMGRYAWLKETPATLACAEEGDEVEIWEMSQWLSSGAERFIVVRSWERDKPGTVRLRPDIADGRVFERVLPASSPARVVKAHKERISAIMAKADASMAKRETFEEWFSAYESRTEAVDDDPIAMARKAWEAARRGM